MSVAVAYPLAVADAAADAAIVAGGIPLAFLALAWYAYESITHDPHWNHAGDSGDSTPSDPSPSPPPPAPPPPGRDDPVVGTGSYAGLARPVRGLVGHDTFLGIGRCPIPCAVPEHIMAIPRRAMREAPPASPRITRSMTRAAKRAGELMESPVVKRTARGFYEHSSVHIERTGHRYNLRVRTHPYRVAAHAFGYGHLAHAIP